VGAGLFAQTDECKFVFPNPVNDEFVTLIGKGVGPAVSTTNGLPPLTIDDIGVGATYLCKLGGVASKRGGYTIPTSGQLVISFGASGSLPIQLWPDDDVLIHNMGWSLEVLFTFVGAGKVNTNTFWLQSTIALTWSASGTDNTLTTGPVTVDIRLKPNRDAEAGEYIESSTGVLTKLY
jgi:hypothetical protein